MCTFLSALNGPDPIMAMLMRDPVVLPSGHTVDRTTIASHLLDNNTDPFSRQPMTIQDVRPDDALRDRIAAWLAEHAHT